MPLRTIAELNASSSPEDVDALRKLEAKKSLIMAELEATKRKLKDAVKLNDISRESEHAKNVAPEDIELHVSSTIAQLLKIDKNAVQWPASLDDLSLSQLDEVWDIIKHDETEADHLISSEGAGVLK